MTTDLVRTLRREKMALEGMALEALTGGARVALPPEGVALEALAP